MLGATNGDSDMTAQFYSAARSALRDGDFASSTQRAVSSARFARRRMAAAVRRGSINRSILTSWLSAIDGYRRRGDWLSAQDFLNEYGAGIDAYCRTVAQKVVA